MGCTVYWSKPILYSELVDPFFKEKVIREGDRMLFGKEDGLRFACGAGKPEPNCDHPDCWYLADNLCDYPIGDGKTCDLLLCFEHRFSMGSNIDFCRIHYLEHQAKVGVKKINPWPPVEAG